MANDGDGAETASDPCCVRHEQAEDLTQEEAADGSGETRDGWAEIDLLKRSTDDITSANTGNDLNDQTDDRGWHEVSPFSAEQNCLRHLAVSVFVIPRCSREPLQQVLADADGVGNRRQRRIQALGWFRRELTTSLIKD
jgi:hypothetical protein